VQTLLLGRDSDENRQVGVERKVEPSASPDSSRELRQAGGLQNRHLHRGSGRVGGCVWGGLVKSDISSNVFKDFSESLE